LWLINADGSGRRALSTPGLQEEDVDALSWSPDGTQLAFTMFNEPGPTQIGVVALPSGGRQQARMLTTQAGGALDPAWSPDGIWLAFAGHDGQALEIFAMQPGDTDAPSPIKLTNDGQLARSPVWSQDGQHIAYLSNKTGNFEIFEIDISTNGSGVLTAS